MAADRRSQGQKRQKIFKEIPQFDPFTLLPLPPTHLQQLLLFELPPFETLYYYKVNQDLKNVLEMVQYFSELSKHLRFPKYSTLCLESVNPYQSTFKIEGTFYRYLSVENIS